MNLNFNFDLNIYNDFNLISHLRQFENLKIIFEDNMNKLLYNAILENNDYYDYNFNIKCMNFIYGQHTINEINRTEHYYHCNCDMLFDSNDSLKITLKLCGVFKKYFNNFQTKKHFYDLYLDIHKFYKNNVFISDQYLKLKSFKSKINSTIIFFKSNYKLKLNQLVLDLCKFYNQNYLDSKLIENFNNINFNLANNQIQSVCSNDYNINVVYSDSMHFDLIEYNCYCSAEIINYFYDLIYFINQTLNVIYGKIKK